MIPEIRRDERGIATLYVHGEPFFCLAGEIHNSSASSLTYMEEEVWPKLEGLNMNAVLVPLYWECIEKEEGHYDFTLPEGLITQAREHGKKLIFLWFGLWKNSESMYIPGWMKTNTKDYFRVRKVNGEAINTVSPFCAKAVEKDAAAFSALMRRIREVDGEENTVIFMQVENEIGLLGTSRDYCEAAEKTFAENVPLELAEKLGLEGGKSWRETFAGDAEEAFMAYAFAGAVERIAAAGRKEYPLPCYANAWLKQYPWFPGSYPSGGPVTGMHRIWRAAAPSLFAFGPDIYVPYVPQILDEYAADGNPLVIPEVRKDAVTAAYCLYAFGQHNAVCYSPFGIEELNMDPSEISIPPMEVMAALNIDPSAFDIAGSSAYLAAAYRLMEEIKPVYLKYRGTDHLRSFVRREETDYGVWMQFEDFDLQIAYALRVPKKPVAGGMIFELASDTFLAVGMQAGLTFSVKAGENAKTEIISLEEGHFENGEWKAGRILNGDEKMSIRLGEMPSCFMIRLFRY